MLPTPALLIIIRGSVRQPSVATVQAVDRFHAILSELFTYTPYVKKLGYDVDGNNVILRAEFDDCDGNEYLARLLHIVRKIHAFEKKMWGGIMPDIDLRIQASPTRRGWPGGISGTTAVIDR